MHGANRLAKLNATAGMKELLKKGSVLILLGTGGVGKTTVAAALGISAAKAGLNTAVITVDPARRLRDALGLGSLARHPTRLSERELRAAGLADDLPLSAMMLDVKAEWDAMARRFAKNPETRQRILENSFYKNLTEQFAGSDAYAALQQLYDLHLTGEFDIEIVDTPPASHAFEFLQAPTRLIRLLDSKSARWLFTPSLSAGRFAMKFASQAARFVVGELERFAGATVLSTIADFFAAASETLDATVDRLHKTEKLLRSSSVHFILVTTAEEDRLVAARELVDEMANEGLKLSAIVINRFLDYETWDEVVRKPDKPPAHLEAVARLGKSLGGDTNQGVRNILDFLGRYRDRTIGDISRVDRWAQELPSQVRLGISPEIEVGIRDLGAINRVSEFLIKPAKTPAGHTWTDGRRRGASSQKPESRNLEG